MEYKNNIIWGQNTLISELLLSAIRHKGHSPKKFTFARQMLQMYIITEINYSCLS